MQFRRSGERRVTIDIAPLVDVVFLLVIFFAATTTFLETSGLKLELPTSTSTTEREVQQLTVFMATDGSLMFEEEQLDRETLRERLAAALQRAEAKIVVLRADTAASHGQVVEVMDVIRQAGAEGLTVATRAAAE